MYLRLWTARVMKCNESPWLCAPPWDQVNSKGCPQCCLPLEADQLQALLPWASVGGLSLWPQSVGTCPIYNISPISLN